MTVDSFQYAEFSGAVQFFCLRLGIPILNKSGLINQNC